MESLETRAERAGLSRRAEGRRLALPVLGPSRAGSSLSRWRAASLLAINVLILVHVAHWALNGRTMAPAVLSESMRTLELGEVNPGFMLFALAILVTLVFGRLLCGWACHMAALQEACAWVLRRLGLRPRTFRSRVLGYVPIGLAAYMFLWPTAKRVAVLPALRAVMPEGATWLEPVAPFQGFHARLVTDDPWIGLFPGWVVAVVFLLVSGCLTVFFLGSRGLCRYACPYAGVLAPVQRLSLTRITVDQGRCDECGRCTAACVTGVQVLDELRAHGRVVDPKCVRALECVAACPTGALGLRIARPEARRPGGRAGARAWDLTWGQEAALVAVFLGALVALRGLYDLIPFLMAASLAACFAAASWKAWRLVGDRDSRLSGASLKQRGRVRPAGAVFLGGVAIAVALLVHSGAVQWLEWMGSRWDGRVRVSPEVVLSGGEVPEDERKAADVALGWYRAASGRVSGGWGLTDTPSILVRMAWLELVSGDAAGAALCLQRAIEVAGPNDALCMELARIELHAGDADRAIEVLEGAAARRGFRGTRDMLASLYLQGGLSGRGADTFAAIARNAPEDADVLDRLGLFELLIGRVPSALRHLQKATRLSPESAPIRANLGTALFLAGRVDEALAELEQAAALDPARAGEHLSLGADMLARAGRLSEAEAWGGRAARSKRSGPSGSPADDP